MRDHAAAVEAIEDALIEAMSRNMARGHFYVDSMRASDADIEAYVEERWQGYKMKAYNGLETLKALGWTPPAAPASEGAGGAEIAQLRADNARLRSAVEQIAGSHLYRRGFDQSDVDEAPDLSAEEAMRAARAARAPGADAEALAVMRAVNAAGQRMLDDFQTSAEHHPKHVLVSLEAFEAMGSAIAAARRLFGGPDA